MNEKVEVSIVCLTYNHEKYIRKALDGFVFQKTTFPYEIVIRDDASTDNTKLIIEEYKKKYPNLFKTIYEVENQFSINNDFSINNLFPFISGKYIAFCDGDDYWIDEYKLQKQYDAVNKHNCVGSVHRVNCHLEDDTISEKAHPSKKYGIDCDKVLDSEELANLLFVKGSYPFQTSCYFVKRIVVEELLKWSSSSQDIYYLFTMLALGDVYYFNKPMSIRRLNTIGNWNSIQKKKGKKGYIQNTKKYIMQLINFNDYSKGFYYDVIKYRINQSIKDWLKKDIFSASLFICKNKKNNNY